MYTQALLKSKENGKYRGKKISNMHTVRKLSFAYCVT